MLLFKCSCCCTSNRLQQLHVILLSAVYNCGKHAPTELHGSYLTAVLALLSSHEPACHRLVTQSKGSHRDPSYSQSPTPTIAELRPELSGHQHRYLCADCAAVLVSVAVRAARHPVLCVLRQLRRWSDGSSRWLDHDTNSAADLSAMPWPGIHGKSPGLEAFLKHTAALEQSDALQILSYSVLKASRESMHGCTPAGIYTRPSTSDSAHELAARCIRVLCRHGAAYGSMLYKIGNKLH